jgi:hypothetical protein
VSRMRIFVVAQCFAGLRAYCLPPPCIAGHGEGESLGEGGHRRGARSTYSGFLTQSRVGSWPHGYIWRVSSLCSARSQTSEPASVLLRRPDRMTSATTWDHSNLFRR